MNSSRLVHELALCHQEMVQLMMRALHHHANKAERLELRQWPSVGAGDDELDAVRQVLRPGVPADPVKLVHMCGDHALDSVERTALAGHRDFDAVIEHTFGCGNVQHHFVHVNQVLARCGNYEVGGATTLTATAIAWPYVEPMLIRIFLCDKDGFDRRIYCPASAITRRPNDYAEEKTA